MVTRNFRDKLRRYFWFSKEESYAFLLAVLAMGFVVSWDRWGKDSFDAVIGLKSLILGIIAMGVVVFTHHAAQRIYALNKGFRIEHHLWWHGFIIGLILVMVSGGKVKFLAATYGIVSILRPHRLGKHRFGPNLYSLKDIMIVGPVANVLLAALVHGLISAGLNFPFLQDLFIFSIWFALCNLLPIPKLDGTYVLYYSRPLYVSVFAIIAAYGWLASAFDIRSFLLATLIGGFLGFIFYWVWEREWR